MASMFTIIKMVFGFVVLLSFSYFTFFVPLGDLTLYQHLNGIAKTPQAKALGTALQKEAGEITAQVEQEMPPTDEVKQKAMAVSNAVVKEVLTSSRSKTSVKKTQKQQRVGTQKVAPRSIFQVIAQSEAHDDRAPSAKDRTALDALIQQKNNEQ